MFTREQAVVFKDDGRTGIVLAIDTSDLTVADPTYYVQFGVPRNSVPAEAIHPHKLRAATGDEVMAWRRSQGW